MTGFLSGCENITVMYFSAELILVTMTQFSRSLRDFDLEKKKKQTLDSQQT